MDSVVLDEKSARQYLDRRLQENDVKGAIEFAIKGQDRFPKLKKLLHFLGNIVVQVSTDDEEIDWYSVLGVDPSSDIKTIKQHYVKLAKDNKLKSREVHKLLNRAWNTLSNKFTRGDYDARRSSRQIQQNASVVKQASSSKQLPQPEPVFDDATGDNISGLKPLPSATEAIQPVPGLNNIRGNNGEDLTSISAATNSIQPTPDVDNVLKNKECVPRSVSTVTPLVQQASGIQTVSGNNGRCLIQLAPSVNKVLGKKETGTMIVSSAKQSTQPVPGMYSVSGNIGIGPRLNISAVKPFQPDPDMSNVSGYSRSGSSKVSSARPSIQPAPSKYDMKKLLTEKARNVILNKLHELNAAARDKNEHNPADAIDDAATEGPNDDVLKTMEVPDSDFHDFDNDRTKESFAENQVWAVYDEDDGMPRLYALIRKASKRSSKLQVSWLNSAGNMEAELLKWINSGFHKTCGDFCIQKKQISIKLNSFSHRVTGWTKKANLFQIFPKKGDVWALYKNWSPEWNKHTTEEEKHKYDMVEVLADYDESKGVTIVPLVKVSGFKAVFCKNSDEKEVRVVPKGEIFRFSHKISSYLLTDQEATNLPNGSQELDPAALPLELLQVLH